MVARKLLSSSSSLSTVDLELLWSLLSTENLFVRRTEEARENADEMWQLHKRRGAFFSSLSTNLLFTNVMISSVVPVGTVYFAFALFKMHTRRKMFCMFGENISTLTIRNRNTFLAKVSIL